MDGPNNVQVAHEVEVLLVVVHLAELGPVLLAFLV